MKDGRKLYVGIIFVFLSFIIYFIDGASAFTSIISTSFFPDSYPIAWRITKPNTPILIPAGMPVATLIPISVGSLCDIELNIQNKVFIKEPENEVLEKAEVWKKIYQEGKFTNFYRDAVKYDGTPVGSHEKKSIKMTINDLTQ